MCQLVVSALRSLVAGTEATAAKNGALTMTNIYAELLLPQILCGALL